VGQGAARLGPFTRLVPAKPLSAKAMRGGEKVRVISMFADRVLEMVAPRVTAAASSQTNCYFINCYCANHEMLQQYCCFINGRHYCSPCQNYLAKC